MAEILVSGPSHPSYRTQQACCNCKHVEWTLDYSDPMYWFCNVFGWLNPETRNVGESWRVWAELEVHPHDICDQHTPGEETCQITKEDVDD